MSFKLKHHLKAISFLLVVMMSILLFVGCTGTTPQDTPVVKTDPGETEDLSLPFKEKVKLTYWSPMSVNVSRTESSFGDIPLYKEIMERLNVELEFIHPAMGEEANVFSLMIASGKYPDIMESWAGYYQGGAIGALNDGVIVPLNDLIDKYCPNYKRLIGEYDDIDKQTMDNEGNYLGFPHILSKEYPVVNWGLVGRKDLFDQIGETIPPQWTIDDLETLLYKLKNETNVKWPFTMTFGGGGSIKSKPANNFLGAWETTYDYFADNDIIKYGMAEPSFKDVLTTLNKWYKDGIYDNDFMTINTPAEWEARCFGAEFGIHGVHIGAIEKTISQSQKVVPEYDLVPLPPPLPVNGNVNRMMGPLDFVGDARVSFSSQNKHLKESAMLLDYGYGEEGRILYSIGLEGESFDITDEGKFVIRDNIFNNEYGITMTDMLYRYARGMNLGSYYIHPKLYPAYWYLPVCDVALNVWTIYKGEFEKNNPLVKGIPTREENASIADQLTEIATYTDEMFVRFVTGQESLDKFDEYISVLNKMGLDDVLKVKQTHHDRYMKGN